MKSKLKPAEIRSALKHAQGWKKSGEAIGRTFVFDDFVHAMAFVNAVALVAEKANHHPDIDIRWNRVVLIVSTHSAGGLTQMDFDLAQAINRI